MIYLPRVLFTKPPKLLPLSHPTSSSHEWTPCHPYPILLLPIIHPKPVPKIFCRLMQGPSLVDLFFCPVSSYDISHKSFLLDLHRFTSILSHLPLRRFCTTPVWHLPDSRSVHVDVTSHRSNHVLSDLRLLSHLYNVFFRSSPPSPLSSPRHPPSV